MSDDLVKRLRQPWDADRSIMSQTGRWMAERKEAADRIDELEAEVRRLSELVPRPDQTHDEIVWRDHLRGVPLAALAKEFGVTKERMRHKLKRIEENKFRLAAIYRTGAD